MKKRLNPVQTFVAAMVFAAILAAGAWAQPFEFKIENPQEGYFTGSMGGSVAVDGDTMIAGAPLTDTNGLMNAGVARVYRADGLGSWTLEAELIASDATSADYFGISVSVSGDTAVVGAIWDDDGGRDSGSATIFTRSGGVWTQQQKLTASDAAAYDRFGGSVSVSGDTAVVGANWDNDGGNDSGSAYVFTRSGGVWTQQQKLTASDAALGDNFGHSVSVSGDTAVVGAYYSDDGGSAYVFTRSGGVWTQQQKLTASSAATFDYFGVSVSVSGDTAVIGANDDNSPDTDPGSAYVFTRSGGVWTQQQKLTASDAAASNYFGNSVSVSGDTTVVGTICDDDGGSNSGSAYVFTRSGGVWTQQQKLTASDAAAVDYFGASVSVSGNTVVVGASGDDDADDESGSAYVFTRSGGVWTQQQKLNFVDAAESDLFGHSVSVSGDTAVVGASYDDGRANNSGSAYVFTRSDWLWTQQQKLTASDAASGDEFGGSVSVSGDTAIVGAHGDDDGAYPNSGSAYIFVRSGGVWTQQQKLTASDAAADDRFGFSVSVSGDTAIVGAYGDDNGWNSDSGSAHVFTRSGGVWTQQQKLIASDAAADDCFGYSVSVSGDTAVVGAYQDDDGSFNSGSVTIFTRSGGVWTEQQKLTAFDALAGDNFGYSVSVSGDTAVVGAYRDDDAASDSGSAHVFTRSDGVWTRQYKLTASDAAESDYFGASVSVSGDTAVVGAHGDDDGGSESGSAYVFTRSGEMWTQQYKLTASDAAGYDTFGVSVATDAGRVAVGASGNDDPETDSGAAYIFSLIPFQVTSLGWLLY